DTHTSDWKYSRFIMPCTRPRREQGARRRSAATSCLGDQELVGPNAFQAGGPQTALHRARTLTRGPWKLLPSAHLAEVDAGLQRLVQEELRHHQRKQARCERARSAIAATNSAG